MKIPLPLFVLVLAIGARAEEPAAISVSIEMLREALPDAIHAEAETVVLESTAPGAARLSRRLRALADNELQAFFETAMATLNAFEALDLPETAARRLEYSASQRVVWVDPPRLGVEHRMESYAGGAHGAHRTDFSAWEIDGERYRRLTLADWITVDGDALAVLERALLDSLRAREAAWVTDGSLTGFDDERLGACLPTPEGLRYHFNEYEVNPYSSGESEVLLPWSLLADWLPPQGPARRWLDASTSGEER